MPADLRLDGVRINGSSVNSGGTANGTFNPGDTIDLEWDVDNIGTTSASSARVGVYFITGSGSDLVDSNTTPTISAGDSETNETDSFTLPSDLTPGIYAILLFADDEGEISESNESNNGYTIYITVTAAGQPDLQIDGVTLNGSSVSDGATVSTTFQPGDTMSLNWDVENNGSGNAPSSRAGVYLVTSTGTQLLESNATSSISAGDADTNESDDITLPSNLEPGLYAIAIIADDQNDVSGESSENNNAYTFFFEVEPGPAVADDWADEPGDGSASMGVVSVGGSATGFIGPADGNDTFGDVDAFRVSLVAGQTYEIRMQSTSVNGQTLATGLFTIRDASFDILNTSAEGSNVALSFTAPSTGDFYIRTGSGGSAPGQGGYQISVTTVASGGDDFADQPGDAPPIGSVNVGSSVTGFIGLADADDTYGDKDVFVVDLVAGQTYQFNLQSISINGQILPSGLFTIRSPSNFNTVLETSGSGSSVTETFVADVTGAYYIRVGVGDQPTDQGGYELSVTNITPPSNDDDYPDYPGDTSALNPVQTLVVDGASRTGAVELAGDTDIFQVTLTAGHTYQFSLDDAAVGGLGPLNSLYMTLRSAGDFQNPLEEDGGVGQATMPFIAPASGIYYVRVGAGEGSASGGYRLNVTDQGIVAPPTVPPPEDPADALAQWIFERRFEFMSYSVGFGEGQFQEIAEIFQGANLLQLEAMANVIGDAFAVIGLVYDAAEVIVALQTSDDPNQELFIRLGDWALGEAIGLGAGFLGGLASGPAAILTAPLASLGAQFVYNTFFSDEFEDYLDFIYDGDYDNQSLSLSGLSLSAPTAEETNQIDPAELIVFDEQFYLATYPEVGAALSAGTIGSAYAHFLTVGIDNGYRPNANDQIARPDLVHSVINNDPTALGNSALLTQTFGAYAGDGASSTEAAVVAAVDGAHIGSLTTDAGLSAIASRKAIDLVANFAASAAATALADTDSAWAGDWSNGNDLTQQFAGAFEALLGADTPTSRYAVFVVASASTSAAAALAQLQTQSAFAAAMANSAFDTIGIGEYGGLWVVILADREGAYSPQAPGADALSAFTDYGSQNPDLMYAGTRTATLYGLDGNDRIVGGPGVDHLYGGAGDDHVYSYSEDFLTSTVANDGANVLDGGDGDDTLRGSGGAETLLGGSGDDTLGGRGGADLIDGGEGIDLGLITRVHLSADYNFDFSLGVGGDITEPGGARFLSIERLQYSGGSGVDTVTGGAMDDLLQGGAGDDTLAGGGGLDRLDGQDGADLLLGGDGDDFLFGSDGDNPTTTDLGDRLVGGAGADWLEGGTGNDILDGGGGVDTSVYALSSTAATWTRNVNGSWTVTSADSTDTLTNVEFLSFTDRDVFLDRAARTFSGNGTSDVLFRRADGIMASWEVTGTSINSASFLPTAPASWNVLGTGDISGDGRDDVIWQRSDGLVYSWTMNGGSVSGAMGIASVGAQWSFLGVGDFNGDLTDDLAWQRTDGLVYIWSMNGSAIQSANAVTALPAAWDIAGMGDFNGDGRDDFLWRNSSTGQSVIWHMNGSAIQSSGATSEQATLDWSVIGVGDTDGDGRDDIILQRASDGMIAVWAMNGTSVLSSTEVAAANPAQWTVRGIGDYNGDGRDDILWQHDNGLVYVWLMNGASIQSAGAIAGIGPEWGII